MQYIQKDRLFKNWEIDDIYFQNNILCFFMVMYFFMFFAISFVAFH